MASTLNGLGHATLKLQRGAGDASGQDLTLLVEELLEEVGILVIDVFDSAFLEAAVLLLLDVFRHRGQVAEFRLVVTCGGVCRCHVV